MSKGDYVEVQVAAGDAAHPVRVTASKAGRSVHVKYTTKWLDVEELTRPTTLNQRGRPTGNKVRVRLEAVISVEERRNEDDDPAPTGVRITRRREDTTAAQDGLDL